MCYHDPTIRTPCCGQPCHDYLAMRRETCPWHKPEMARQETDKSRILKFVDGWRTHILARHPKHPELLSLEEFGQLVALNTIISYIKDM